ncbi:MAG: ATPase [Paludibacteraceae bacterium]|nr:ATPase [Paludibacteraceae bacterium]
MKNTILFDSGSTKTDIRIICNRQITELQCAGINPFYQNGDEIYHALRNCFGQDENLEEFNIFFYGAGCSFEEKKEIVRSALSHLFPKSCIIIENDLLGAARALLQRKNGIACILGTGANSCLYQGGEIIKNVPPLGYILGDEGSGANIGKLLVADILKGIAPQEVILRFYEEEKCSCEEIMNRIYKGSFPNRYLATFSKHIYRHIDEIYFQNLILEAFDNFFKRNIVQYDPTVKEIGFVGSIALHFAPQLEITAQKYGYSIQQILKSPIEGLITYHTASPRE